MYSPCLPAKANKCFLWSDELGLLLNQIFNGCRLVYIKSHFIAGMIGVSRSTNISSSNNSLELHQILCCAYNASGTVFVTGSSDRHARVWGVCVCVIYKLHYCCALCA